MKRPITILTRVVAPILVIALALGAATRLVKSKPKAKRADRVLSAPLVEVFPAALGAHTLMVDATGTMRPAHLLVVQPQVSGAIIDHHPALVPGGLIDEGEVLLTIDARDYELALERQRAQVARARLDLRVENGRQAIAEQEWDTMAKELVMMERADEALAKREPQVEAARAGVQAARGAVETAQLSLDRTRIIAPFNAVVREEAVEVGQVVGPGYPWATLAGTDVAWVEVAVPVSALLQLSIPGHNVSDEEEGSSATIEQKTATGASIKRSGKVIRLLRELEPRGRMARLIVAVEDPMELALDVEEMQLPLLTGAFVSVRIEGNELDEVVSVPREALRDGRYVWVSTPEKTLAIREVQVGWSERTHVLVTGGLFDGDNVVVSPLAAPVEGMALRVQVRAPSSSAEDASLREGDAEDSGDIEENTDAEGTSQDEVGPDAEVVP